MSKRFFNFVDGAEITVVSRDSVDNFEELAQEVGCNTYNQVLNMIFFKIAKLAGDAHWNPSECDLGDFTREQTKDLNDTNNPFEDPEVIELCNEYGRACLKSKTVPLLVLRDSNTGDILDLPYEKVRPFLNDPMVKLFLEHYYEI